MGCTGGGVVRELERNMDIELMLVHQARLFSEESKLMYHVTF